MVAREFFEVLNSYDFFSMMVLKVARKSIGERVKKVEKCNKMAVKLFKIGNFIGSLRTC